MLKGLHFSCSHSPFMAHNSAISRICKLCPCLTICQTLFQCSLPQFLYNAGSSFTYPYVHENICLWWVSCEGNAVPDSFSNSSAFLGRYTCRQSALVERHRSLSLRPEKFRWHIHLDACSKQILEPGQERKVSWAVQPYLWICGQAFLVWRFHHKRFLPLLSLQQPVFWNNCIPDSLASIPIHSR